MPISTASSYIADMQSKIHAVLDPLATDEPYALVDFPDINNVGDSAIWVGEIAYFNKHLKRGPTYSCTLHNLSAERLEQTVPNGPIFIHGGGNFGDIWMGHQVFREHVLERWPDRRVIQLPQSLHFSSDDKLEQAKRAVNAHKNFTLLVRDEYSLELSRKHFDCQAVLCPDMAFSIGSTKPIGPVEFAILAMLRKDKEQTGEDPPAFLADIPVEDWINDGGKPVRRAAMIARLLTMPTLNRAAVRTAGYNARAQARFDLGVRQLSRGKVIITDRLHVHIISTLLGKPHAVLDNSYGKIGRFRAAFPEPPGITYAATSLRDALDWAQQQS